MPTGRLTGEAVGAIVANYLPEHAIVVDESVTAGRQFASQMAGASPHSWLGLTGGAIGIGMPLGVGAGIACQDRKVVVLEADGSGMYTLQSLWTMARESIDATVVILSNRAYQILRGELKNVGVEKMGPVASEMLSLDNPPLDWVSIAAGMGVSGERVDDSGGVIHAFNRGIVLPGPYLIEAVI